MVTMPSWLSVLLCFVSFEICLISLVLIFRIFSVSRVTIFTLSIYFRCAWTSHWHLCVFLLNFSKTHRSLTVLVTISSFLFLNLLIFHFFYSAFKLLLASVVKFMVPELNFCLLLLIAVNVFCLFPSSCLFHHLR